MDWEHGRRAVGISAAHWEPEGLTDYNPKSLTRSVAPGCWCVIFSSSTVNGNRACHGGPFTGKMYRSAQNPAHTSHPCAAVRTSWRFSRCRFPGKSSVLPHGYVFLLSRCFLQTNSVRILSNVALSSISTASRLRRIALSCFGDRYL